MNICLFPHCVTRHPCLSSSGHQNVASGFYDFVDVQHFLVGDLSVLESVVAPTFSHDVPAYAVVLSEQTFAHERCSVFSCCVCDCGDVCICSVLVLVLALEVFEDIVLVFVCLVILMLVPLVLLWFLFLCHTQ